MMSATPVFDNLTCEIVSLHEAAKAQLRCEQVTENVALIYVSISGMDPIESDRICVKLRMPGLDTNCVFIPHLSAGQSVWPDYDNNGHISRVSWHVPLQSVYGSDGTNRCTVALSNVLDEARIGFGIEEETCDLIARIRPFIGGRPNGTYLSAVLRIDRRPLPWDNVVKDSVAWWDAQAELAPLPTPELGRLPMYSTWYAFHQQMDAESLIEECRLAKELGCEAVIIDDGWQTQDNTRTYAVSGDWQPERFGDMRALVERLHEQGIGVLLWYGLPHAGTRTQTYRKLSAHLLRDEKRKEFQVLDPRSEEVRRHLRQLLTQQISNWKLDGVKLDFVDLFAAQPGLPGEMPVACDALIQDLARELLRLKPDLLIEFRQPYVSPRMRAAANLFRAVDCPNDAMRNKARILTLRLLVGRSTVHSDMIMWHASENVEVAARQMLAILFSVPQLSVRLQRIPESHLQMLRFWLRWWREHRDCLLDGELTCTSPEQGWPMVSASSNLETIVAVYAEYLIKLPETIPGSFWIVNATVNDYVLTKFPDSGAIYKLELWNCMGNNLEARTVRSGLHMLPIPPSGLARLTESV